ncbi:IS5 family transposase [Micromonospora sp. NPDC005299]|uniref:IS5 family transposase n=1 Tax=Micromonospora sp. NPDC005299 TaxID=3364231 RepID=UPI0036CEEB0C
MAERPAYPSDLSDARWALIAPRLDAWRQARTDAGVGGRKPTYDLREIFNAILYVNHTGIAWRYLPHDFPPWQTVYGYFTAWTGDGIFTQINYELTGLARAKAGRAAQQSAGVIDTQSVKTSTNAPLASQGIDAGKKIVGRKRGIVTDTLGLLLAVIVTAASASDNTIGIDLLDQAKATHPAGQDLGRRRLQEQGHRTRRHPRHRRRGRHQGPAHQRVLGVKRLWVVERTLGWIMLHRRLARDYEALPDNSASMIRIAMIDNLTKRVTDETTPTWRDI